MRAIAWMGLAAVAAGATAWFELRHPSAPPRAHVAIVTDDASEAPAAPAPIAPAARAPIAHAMPKRVTIPAPSPAVAPDDDDAPKTPERGRALMRAQLESTSPSREAWTMDATDVFSRLEKSATGATLSRAECFRAGCRVTASYGSRDAFDAMNQSFPQSDEFQRWPGGKYRSPPVTHDDGSVECDWILFRPEGA